MDDLKAWQALAQQHVGITQSLATFIAGLGVKDIPGPTQSVLSRALIDSVGCGLHGLSTPWGQIMRDFALAQGGPPEAGVWAGGEQRVAVAQSVLAAGTAIHGFDFDDHSRAKIHPGAVVVPVVLALGQHVGASGEQALVAMAAGYETMNRVSQAANPGRARMRGWHLTGTAGTFAAAAAASVLLKLDASTTASALGLAGTQSAGLWAFTADGGMSKRLHPGRAAQAGVTAALLAQRGFEGPRLILEAKDGGFLFAMSDSPRPAEITRELGTFWHTDFTCFKPYACCGSNHACIDAVLHLMREHNLEVDDISRIIAGIPSVVQTQTGFPYMADSVLNAQMSLQYNVAVAMIDRQAYLPQFTPERIVEPGVVQLAKRVEIVVDEELDALYPEIYGGRITLVTKAGESHSLRVDYSKGMPENQMSTDDIAAKYMSLARAVTDEKTAVDVLNKARHAFDSPSIGALNDALSRVTLLEAVGCPA